MRKNVRIQGMKSKNIIKSGIIPVSGVKIRKWSKIYDGVLRLLFPCRCPACDEIVGGMGEKLCLECIGRLKLLTPPWCMKCGKKLAEQKEYCADCTRKEHEYIRGRALYEYEYAALSIYRFKYGGRREYAAFFGEQIGEYLEDFIRKIRPDALIPIPLHKKRENVRGYNQAELLAQSIGSCLGIPVYSNFLIRKKNTAPLKYENPEERQNNLKKAFNIRQNDVKLDKVILIDDIYTTGSTMDEAARTLKAAGVEKIYFIALACGAGV